MTPNTGGSGEAGNHRRPRDMALVSVSLISISLIWAGTHQVGRASMERDFAAIEWTLAVALLIAGGFLFTSLIIPVDIRRRFDVWTFTVIGGVPLIVLAYSLYAQAVGPIRVLDKLLGWATPYGIVAMAVLVGFAMAASFQVKPPTPSVSTEGLSTLSLPE